MLFRHVIPGPPLSVTWTNDLMLCWRSKNAQHVTRDAQLKPRPLLNLSSREFPLAQLLHHPCLDDVHQALNLLFCVTRMQTNSHSLSTFWYSWRHDTTNNEALSLTVRSELFWCGCEEREDGRLRGLRRDGEEWDIFIVGSVRECGDQGLE